MISRSLFICVLACLMMACQSSSTAQQPSESTVTIRNTPPSSQSNSKAKKALAAPVAHLDAPMKDGTYPFDLKLRDADGNEYSSADVLKYKGKPTIVSFWLTTCGPCRMEFAAIKGKYAKWQEEADFNMVAISTDFEKNHQAFVDMTKKNEWPWEVYLDVDRAFWKVMPGALNGLPQVFIYDENGEIVYYKRKYKPGDEDTLFAKVKELQ